MPHKFLFDVQSAFDHLWAWLKFPRQSNRKPATLNSPWSGQTERSLGSNRQRHWNHIFWWFSQSWFQSVFGQSGFPGRREVGKHCFFWVQTMTKLPPSSLTWWSIRCTKLFVTRIRFPPTSALPFFSDRHVGEDEGSLYIVSAPTWKSSVKTNEKNSWCLCSWQGETFASDSSSACPADDFKYSTFRPGLYQLGTSRVACWLHAPCCIILGHNGPKWHGGKLTLMM